MPITKYGANFLPWGSHLNTDGVSITGGGAGVYGSWTAITLPTTFGTFGFYPTSVSVGSTTPVAVQVGYGPAGAERTVAEGITHIPFAVPGEFIPAGARMVARITGGGALITAVEGIRADKWAPTFSATGPRQTNVVPTLAEVAVGAAPYTTLVAPLLYPFILTDIYVRGTTGTANTSFAVLSVGAAGEEVPVVATGVGRGDALGRVYRTLNPPPLPFPAGSRIAAVTTGGAMTCVVMIAGLRIDT